MTKYHVIHSSRGWRFYKEGAKRSYIRSKGKSEVMVAAVYKIAEDGGDLIVHNEDGTVDFVLDNWNG
jgi:hypothetical protein